MDGIMFAYFICAIPHMPVMSSLKHVTQYFIDGISLPEKNELWNIVEVLYNHWNYFHVNLVTHGWSESLIVNKNHLERYESFATVCM